MVKLHHLTISVSDLARAQRFYEELGFKYVRDFERIDYPAKFRDLKINSFCLRLVEFIGQKNKIPPCYEDPIVNFHTIGPKHFALEVDDLDKIKLSLEMKGCIFYDGKNKGGLAKIQKGVSGVRYIFLKDDDGNLVELVEEDKKW